jgi:hypothetical protein
MQTIKELICLLLALVAVNYKLYKEGIELQIIFKIVGYNNFISIIYITINSSKQSASAHIKQLIYNRKRHLV